MTQIPNTNCHMKIFCKFLLSLIVLFVLPACEFFFSSPFPDYLGNVILDKSYRNEVSALLANAGSKGEITTILNRAQYQMFSLNHGDGQRLYLLIIPELIAEDATGNRSLNQRVILQFRQTGEFERSIYLPGVVPLGLSFGTPFVLANSPNEQIITRNLAIEVKDDNSYGIVTVGAGNSNPKELQHGLRSGYGVPVSREKLEARYSNRAGTYLFSGNGNPSSGYSAINISALDTRLDRLGIDTTTHSTPRQIQIDHQARSGYVLKGVVPDGSGNNILLLVEHLADNVLYIGQINYQDLVLYYDEGRAEDNPFILFPENAQRVQISLEGSVLFFYSHTDIIVLRANGRMVRYNFQGTLLDSVKSELRAQVLYSISENGEYIYRYDPEIFRLRVIKKWW